MKRSRKLWLGVTFVHMKLWRYSFKGVRDQTYGIEPNIHYNGLITKQRSRAMLNSIAKETRALRS